MLSVDEINKLQSDNKRLNDIIDSYQPRLQKYKDVLQEIKEKCNEARRTGRKAYLPIDILELITKAEEE